MGERASVRIAHLVALGLYQAIDFVFVVLSIMVCYKVYRILGLGQTVFYQKFDIIRTSLLLGVGTVLIMQVFGAYSKQSSVMNVEEIRKTLRGITAAYVLFMFVLVFGHFALSRYVVAMSYVFSVGLLLIVKTCLYHMQPFHGSVFNGLAQQRVLIYGAGELGQALYREMANSPKLGILPVGFIDDNPAKADKVYYQSGFKTSKGISVLGTLKDIERLKEQLDIREVYIAISNVDRLKLTYIIETVREQGMKTFFVPNLYRFYRQNIQVSQIGQIPVVAEDEAYNQRYLYVKRCLDLCLSLIVLAVLSPLFLLIPLLIKADSKGPVFFKQDRVGKDGKIFRIYKFRSMFVTVDPYAVNPLAHSDPRITRTGRFLRKSSLDELPQIINVLEGHMSLVGPRPEMPFIVKDYNDTHRERLKVPPGITGLWQLSGDRKKAIHENMDYDLYYVRNLSLSLDIAILLETLMFAFKGI